MKKLGVHGNGISTEEAKAWARVANIVKQLDGTDLLGIARPSAIRVFRHYISNQDVGRDGALVATEVLDALGGYRHPNLYVELFVGTGMSLGNGLEDLVRMTKEAVPVLHAHGVKVAGFSFYEGNGNGLDWWYIQDEEFAYVDAISMQEYWFEAPPAGFDSWHALRYRRVHAWLDPENEGGHHPPFIITECGRHAVSATCAHDDDCGWLSTDLRNNPQAYVDELIAYDNELSKDYYVLGGCVYTGAPNYDWVTFDTDRVTDKILATYEETEVGKMTTAHEHFDGWFRIFGQGYNPDTAIGKYRDDNSWLGVAMSGEIESDLDGEPIVKQYFTGGIVIARKSDWVTIGGDTEEELAFPL